MQLVGQPLGGSCLLLPQNYANQLITGASGGRHSLILNTYYINFLLIFFFFLSLLRAKGRAICCNMCCKLLQLSGRAVGIVGLSEMCCQPGGHTKCSCGKRAPARSPSRVACLACCSTPCCCCRRRRRRRRSGGGATQSDS